MGNAEERAGLGPRVVTVVMVKLFLQNLVCLWAFSLMGKERNVLSPLLTTSTEQSWLGIRNKKVLVTALLL